MDWWWTKIRYVIRWGLFPYFYFIFFHTLGCGRHQHHLSIVAINRSQAYLYLYHHNPLNLGAHRSNKRLTLTYLKTGDYNGLVLHHYSADSIFYEQQRQATSECSDIRSDIAEDLACQPRGGTRRPRPDSDSDSDEEAISEHRPPMRRPRVCSAGAESLYSDRECCDGLKGYEWISLTVGKAIEGVLFGIGKVIKEGGIGFCEAAARGS